MESILDSVKTLLGIQTDDYSFDKELVIHINSALMSLYQAACGLQNFEIKIILKREYPAQSPLIFCMSDVIN